MTLKRLGTTALARSVGELWPKFPRALSVTLTVLERVKDLKLRTAFIGCVHVSESGVTLHIGF